MKILPLAKEIKSDISLSSIRLKQASENGYKIANRTAKIYNQSNFKKYINVTRSISNKIAKNTTVKELPYIAGAIGMLIPLPLISPICFGVGYIIRIFIDNKKQTIPPTKNFRF